MAGSYSTPSVTSARRPRQTDPGFTLTSFPIGEDTGRERYAARILALRERAFALDATSRSAHDTPAQPTASPQWTART